MGRLLGVKEVCKELGLGPGLVRRLIEQGRLSAVNVSSGSRYPRWKVTEDAIHRFLNPQDNVSSEKTAEIATSNRRK